MNLLKKITKWFKSHLVVSIIVSIIVVCAAIATIIINNNKIHESEENQQLLKKEWMNKFEGYYINDAFQHTRISLSLDKEGNAEVCYGGSCTYPTFDYVYPDSFKFNSENNYFTSCSSICGYPDATNEKAQGLICYSSNGEPKFLPKVITSMSSRRDETGAISHSSFVYDYIPCEEEKVAEKEETLEKNDIVQDLYKMVSVYSDSLKDWYFYQNEEVTLNSISNNQKLFLAYSHLPETVFNTIERKSEDGQLVDEKTAFNASDLDKSMKEIFGNDIKYENDDFSTYNCGGYEYYNNIKKYVSFGGGCGDSPEGMTLKTLFYKDEKKKNEIIIYEKFAFIDEEMNLSDNSMLTGYKYSLYKDANKQHLIKVSSEEINISDYVDNLSMVKYTFKKENNEYHFYSSKIVNSLKE